MQAFNSFGGGHSWIRSSLGTYVYIWKLLLSSIDISRVYHMHLLTSVRLCGQKSWAVVWKDGCGIRGAKKKKVVALNSFTL
jgi:hypothetical protein